MIDLKKLYDTLNSRDNFILTTHVNPDADAIGSVVGMGIILSRLNKKFRIVNYSHTPYYLEFLDPEKWIEVYDPEKHKTAFSDAENIICLDFNRVDRTAKMQHLLRESHAYKICIDHHTNPDTEFFDEIFFDIEHAATGHILFNLTEEFPEIGMDYNLALPLYAAIMTDTGSFRFERTTPEIHRIAAKCLELGVVPIEVQEKIYDSNKPGKIKLLGEVIDSMEIIHNGELVIMQITKDALERNQVEENGTDGFINLGLSIIGVKMVLLFHEVKEGFKVSLRSRGNVYVNEFAGKYGGGGHKYASGIRIRDAKLEDYKEDIISEAILHLEKSKDND